jgi:hypothetical protein
VADARYRESTALVKAGAVDAAPALSATKVSFGQVSPTATVWPGVVAAKEGFSAYCGI